MLRLEEVSVRLGGTPVKTSQNWIYAGKLPAYKPGKHPLVREEDLDALLKQSLMVK